MALSLFDRELIETALELPARNALTPAQITDYEARLVADDVARVAGRFGGEQDG